MIVFSVSLSHGTVGLTLMPCEGSGSGLQGRRKSSNFLFAIDMIFDGNRHLGVPKEGTVDNLVVVLGCTVRMFANFLDWLNHK